MKSVWSKLVVISILMAMLMGMTGCQNNVSTISEETKPITQDLNESSDETLKEATVEMTQDGSVVSSETIDKLERVDEIINTNYYFDGDTSAMQEEIIRGYVEGLKDEYAVYYSADEYAAIVQYLNNGEYVGVGVEVYPYGSELTVTNVYGPAKETGIKEWDVLTKVNGEFATYDEIYAEMNPFEGQEGTEVTLTVYRPSEEQEYTYTIKQQSIVIPTVQYRMLENHIGYIRISMFRALTAEDYLKALTYLNAQGMEGLIVDIRDNSGGSLNVTCNILDYMLPDGMIFYGKDKAGNVVWDYKSVVEYQFDKPLAVLINGNSASASEAFAGAIKDYGVGTLIGETTFGKGIGQQYFTLEDGSAVKLTTYEFFTPKGNRIHKVGVEPDLEVTLDVEACRKSGGEKDNQLQAAIDIIKEEILEGV